MLFNSFVYLVFFTAVVLLFYILPHKSRWVMLLLASAAFYMAWVPELILLLLAVAFVNWACAELISRSGGRRLRKIWLIADLALSFGALFVFKYLGFIGRSLAAFFGFFGQNFPAGHVSLILPMGISFYTFHSVGYAIDMYRGSYPRERNFLKFALFVTFFPQLVAGPIGRADKLLPSLLERKDFRPENISAGVKQMLLGYFKKVLVADRLALAVNTVYKAPQYHLGLQSVIATVFFAVQIYCDFSGYTDIAIGCARCMGVDLMKNFNQPYLSGSVREFWRRWHISLSAWFRDYLYIPMGGSRVSKPRRAFNVMVTFLVSGLWHGADWTFVIWGGLHGLFQNAETWLEERVRPWRTRVIRALRYPLTFAAVCFAWIFFRADTLSDAFRMIGGLFDGAGRWGDRQFVYAALTGMGVSLLDLLIDAGLVLLVFGMELIGRDKSVYENMERRGALARGAFYFAAAALICCFGVFEHGGMFIYFQF
ncbi:MAG: MBOAT family protein [Firmicutes bacterium]|nr:MBOAT family protein [Bacillota bacterium]